MPTPDDDDDGENDDDNDDGASRPFPRAVDEDDDECGVSFVVVHGASSPTSSILWLDDAIPCMISTFANTNIDDNASTVVVGSMMDRAHPMTWDDDGGGGAVSVEGGAFVGAGGTQIRTLCVTARYLP